MPAFSRPNCYLRLGGNDYELRRDGLDLTYMPNGWQVAKCIIDLNSSTAPSPSTFASETAVDVKIENVTMMTGYVVTSKRVCQPLTERSPGKNLGLELLIADKVGYLMKGEFANDYFRSKTIQRLLQDLAGTLGVTHSISASLSNTFKRSFFGTMGKDAAAFAVEKGADWFGDESGVLNAWPQASPPTLTTGGFTYQIQDFTSGASHQIEVSHLHPYYYIPDDALHRYRNVKVMNSNRVTFPRDINRITSEMFWNGTLGYSTPRWISGIPISGSPIYFRPGRPEPGPKLGGDTDEPEAPAMAFKTENTNDILFARVWYIASDNSLIDNKYLNVKLGVTERLWFHIYTTVNLADASEVKVQLIDQTTGTYYERNIKGDINASNTWVFLLYQLPTITSGASGTISNGWTKQGAADMNKIDVIDFTFIKSSTGDGTGWPVNSWIKFATLFFEKRVSKTASGAGGLNLTKPIVNDSIQNASDLQDQANKELVRVGYATKAGCTCPGHTDFRRPGYQMNVNFDQTFGSGHSGSLRMERIRHYTDRRGFYWMELEYGPALQRL